MKQGAAVDSSSQWKKFMDQVNPILDSNIYIHMNCQQWPNKFAVFMQNNFSLLLMPSATLVVLFVFCQ